MEDNTETIEYFAFYAMPIDPVPLQWMWMFTEPVKLFGSGPNGRKMAEAWVKEANKLRWAARAETGEGLQEDNIAGEMIDMVVMSQKIVRHDYQLVE